MFEYQLVEQNNSAKLLQNCFKLRLCHFYQKKDAATGAFIGCIILTMVLVPTWSCQREKFEIAARKSDENFVLFLGRTVELCILTLWRRLRDAV